MTLERTWKLRSPDSTLVSNLCDSAKLSQIVAGLLVNRGITEPNDAAQFLSPGLKQLADPYTMLGMDVAVERILSAIKNDERITIYGDYDVDGMTSAAILTRFFRSIGYEPHCFLPNRFTDGYGLNPDRLQELVADGTQLFISVDCGTTAVEPIAVVRELGADFVVVDHHQPPQGALPNATAILNPHQKGCDFKFKDLCAAGLAFYLTMALRLEMRRRGEFADNSEPDLRELLDLTAIGTIADVVPLHGLNRILVTSGLSRIEHSPHQGVRALRALTNTDRPVDSSTVAFQIGPRLNAAGRLSHPFKGYRLLSTDSAEEARAIADEIEAENLQRRSVQATIEEEAVAMATDLGEEQSAYVLWSPDWHAGVSGVVASRIVERFHRPCVMIAIVDGIGKGSIRSIRGFDCVAGLRQCASLLDQFGGHPHAAGITVQPDNLEAFRAAFSEAAKELTPVESLTPSLKLDAYVRFSDLSDTLMAELERLAPFGAGNPQPVLASRRVEVVGVRKVGQDKSHLKLELRDDGVTIGAIAFGRGADAPQTGQFIDVAYCAEYNHFRGRISLQLRVRDFKASV